MLLSFLSQGSALFLPQFLKLLTRLLNYYLPAGRQGKLLWRRTLQ